ncbi:MAG: hypothetical protein JRI34_06155, partial [Deltaproteobacteria bacterium]|nr:hypothetical protein [Deltaproteobacteria bacterium]
ASPKVSTISELARGMLNISSRTARRTTGSTERISFASSFEITLGLSFNVPTPPGELLARIAS